MILRQPADEARVLLLRWSGKAAPSGIDPFTGLGEKIGRRCEDIVRTIRSGLSNARLEAVNNKIKTTIKIGYGYRNLDNLIALVMLKMRRTRPHTPRTTITSRTTNDPHPHKHPNTH